MLAKNRIFAQIIHLRIQLITYLSMNRIIITFLFLLMAHGVSAQYVERMTVLQQKFVVLNMQSETLGIDDVKVYFSRSSARRLVKKLKKWSEEVSSIAYNHYLQPSKEGKVAISGTAKFDLLSFSIRDKKWYDDKYFIVPSFVIDGGGQCCLQLRGYYSGDVNLYIQPSDKLEHGFNYSCIVPVLDLANWIEEIKGY